MALWGDICASSVCVSTEMNLKPHWTWPCLRISVSKASLFPNGPIQAIYDLFTDGITSSTIQALTILAWSQYHIYAIFRHISEVWHSNTIWGVLRTPRGCGQPFNPGLSSIKVYSPLPWAQNFQDLVPPMNFEEKQCMTSLCSRTPTPQKDLSASLFHCAVVNQSDSSGTLIQSSTSAFDLVISLLTLLLSQADGIFLPSG